MSETWFEELDKEERAQAFKFKIEHKKRQVKEWYVCNKDMITKMAPVVLGCAVVVIINTSRSIKAGKQ